jgi:penicillin-binding protein 1A
MKYLRYAFWGLFSLGFAGLIVGVMSVLFIVQYYAQDLPDHSQLKNYDPPIVTRLYAGDGRLMAEFAQEKRVFVPIDSIPELVKNAFIAVEDQNFYEHEGVDFLAIVAAAIDNFKHKGSRGASTITQQVVKNFLLSNERSYVRKIKEAILAYRMERAMSKDRILELYLNQIFLGQRAYGVAAASLEYFNKSLDELTVAEAAYLAGLPKAPNNYHPTRKPKEAVERRNLVIRRMRSEGYITKEQAELATAMPLQTVKRDDSVIVNAPFFAEEVRREIVEHYGQDSLYGGGLVVRTTIDPKLQDIALKALRGGLQAYDQRHGYRGAFKHFDTMSDWRAELEKIARPIEMPDTWKLAAVLSVSDNAAAIGFAGDDSDSGKGTIKLENLKWAREYQNEGYSQGPEIASAAQVVKEGDIVMVEAVKGEQQSYALKQVPLVQGAVVAMDPHTGRILAMQGGWKYKYGSSEYNRATQARRQPGSAFKPFIYTAALEKGFTPSSLVQDAPFVIEDRPGHFWAPTNYKEEYYGPTTLRVGLEKSRNLMTVRLAHHLGMDVVADYAERFGVVDKLPLHLANALGAAETTPIRMTAAYAVFVNGGKKVIPTVIDRIQDRRGQTIFRHDKRSCENCGDLIKWEGQPVPEIPDTREQIIQPTTAYQMVSIMEGVVQRGTATALKELDRPLAGKTGTTNKSNDTWFMGFSPDLVVGVFVGFDQPRSLGKKETGGSTALPVFKLFMADALKDTPAMPFRIPPGVKNIQVNASTGRLAGPGDTNIIWEAFVTGTEPAGESYILDGSGVNVVPTEIYDQGDTYSGGAFTNVPSGPYTGGEAPGYQSLYPETVSPSEEPTTGTGGIY